MGLTSNGITKPLPDGITLLSRYILNDPSTGISGHVQRIALVDARIGQYGEVGVVNGGLGVSLVDGLAVGKDSVMTYPRGSDGLGRSTTGNICGSPGKLTGIWVSSASNTPTITVYDSATTTTTTLKIPTFTPVGPFFYPFPHLRFDSGIYIVITGTVNYTPCYDPTTF